MPLLESQTAVTFALGEGERLDCASLIPIYLPARETISHPPSPVPCYPLLSSLVPCAPSGLCFPSSLLLSLFLHLPPCHLFLVPVFFVPACPSRASSPRRDKPFACVSVDEPPGPSAQQQLPGLCQARWGGDALEPKHLTYSYGDDLSLCIYLYSCWQTWP